MPHNPALDTLNEAMRHAQTDGTPHSRETVDTATQILLQPPALPAPSVKLSPDRCELFWTSPKDDGSSLALDVRQNGTVNCSVKASPGAETTTGRISTGHAGWVFIVRGYIALAARAGIISAETVSLSAAPNLLQFCRAVTAVADLSRQLQIPGQHHWPATAALLAAYWPDWDCPWIPDGVTSSPESNLIINLMDPAEPAGQFPKHIINTLLTACRMAAAQTGEPPADTAEINTELQDWLNSGQTKSRRDLGIILHTAERLLDDLNSRVPAELLQPAPEREPPLTLEAFRQELTLAVLRTHQAGIRPTEPKPD